MNFCSNIKIKCKNLLNPAVYTKSLVYLFRILAAQRFYIYIFGTPYQIWNILEF